MIAQDTSLARCTRRWCWASASWRCSAIPFQVSRCIGHSWDIQLANSDVLQSSFLASGPLPSASAYTTASYRPCSSKPRVSSRSLSVPSLKRVYSVYAPHSRTDSDDFASRYAGTSSPQKSFGDVCMGSWVSVLSYGGREPLRTRRW